MCFRLTAGEPRAIGTDHDGGGYGTDGRAIATAVPGALDEKNHRILSPSSNLQDAEPQAPKNVTPGFVGEPSLPTSERERERLIFEIS